MGITAGYHAQVLMLEVYAVTTDTVKAMQRIPRLPVYVRMASKALAVQSNVQVFRKMVNHAMAVVHATWRLMMLQFVPVLQDLWAKTVG